jgi:uncharacterized protein (DUF58 family)
MARATRRAPDLARFDGLAIRVRRGMGDRPGERRFPGRPEPAGIELESHSAYTPGDDLRHLDWSAYARLDALLVRRFTAEREVCFELVVDGSASMGVPARDDKFGVARELALVLAYVALSANDAVRVTVLPGARSPVLRQRASVRRVAELLAAAAPAGALALGAALEEAARALRRPHAFLVVSDLMADAAEVGRGVLALRARGHEVTLLHVIARGELEPEREFRQGVLHDVESGETHPLVLTDAVRLRYRALLDAHLAALEDLAERTGSLYARLATDAPLDEFVTGTLARRGLITRR